ncbi:ABC transporter substrate-binding protein/permease [Eupransor demetentiae]|uniref:Periplasmic component/domain (HisJ) n=1 Tax=Eupransor demetentiae TaxID=3109584 RepID=A0ABP0ENX6_9LACO|nr:ABC-type amino acid transport/signal transduction system [Lactobacillaceae bacterium LMG 33000]
MEKKLNRAWALIIGTVLIALAILIGQSSAQADSSVASIKERGVLKVALSPDYPPFEFQSKAGGQSEDAGIDIQVAQKIAKDLGVKLQIMNMSFASVLVAVEIGKADLAIGGINPTPARRQNVAFSDYYYNGGQVFLLTKEGAKQLKKASQLSGKTIGAQSSSLQYKLAKDKYTDSKVVGMDKSSDLVLALKGKKIDAMGIEKPVAEAYIENDHSLTMIPADYNLSADETGAAIAAAKGNDELINEVNKSINEIKSQNLMKTYLKNAAHKLKDTTANTSMLHYWQYFLNGLLYTLYISVWAIIGGMILGAILSLMKMSAWKVLNWPAVSFIEVVRGTPIMVQILLVYFGLGLLINIPALTAGIIAVTLNSAAYVAEIIRGGINAVNKGQFEAAQSLGLSKKDQYRFVIFPQAIKNIWPALGNEFISIIKESSIVSIIGVTDLVYELNIVKADTYRGVAPIVVVMVIYFIVTFGLGRLLGHFERKMKYGN